MYKQLIERIHEEHKAFLAELKQMPAEEIIRRAYEICYREEFVSLLECKCLDDEDIAKLLKLPDPVGFLYHKWLKTDASVCEMLEDVIADYLDEED